MSTCRWSADFIAAGSRVLDVGCGDGELLELLQRDKDVDGRGVEISQRGVNECVSRGLSVIQGDADSDLVFYPDKGFDFVILSQTLQATRNPRAVLEDLLRIGNRAIVSFPNFGHWSVRLSLLLRGRMPVTKDLPYSWYDTPNIHFCTIRDFVDAVRRDRRQGRAGDRARRCRPAYRAVDALVVLEFLWPAGGVSAQALIPAITCRAPGNTDRNKGAGRARP